MYETSRILRADNNNNNNNNNADISGSGNCARSSTSKVTDTVQPQYAIVPAYGLISCNAKISNTGVNRMYTKKQATLINNFKAVLWNLVFFKSANCAVLFNHTWIATA
jgi:hypothetical protein